MNKLSKEKREKLMLIIMGIAGVVGALYLLVVCAQQTALQEYSDKVEIAREKLEKAELWLRMSSAIDSRLAASRAQLEARQADMAPADKFKWFYNTLENFRLQHHVELVELTREPLVGELGVLPKFPYQAASFGVTLSGRYHELGAFLADFENRFPYMRVQNVKLQPESATTSVGKDEPPVSDHAPRHPQALAATMRIVTLVKPLASL